MNAYLIAYAVTAAIFLACDAVWLRFSADMLYRPQLGDLLLTRFHLVPAALFYLLYIAGVVKFAVMPALAEGRWLTALLNGAMLGLVAYGTYDLTNQATLKNWSTLVTIADLCWGTALTAAASALAYYITRSVLGSS